MLGDAARLPIEPLASAGGLKWRHQAEIEITVPVPGKTGKHANLTALETYGYELADADRADAEIWTLRKQYSLKRADRSGREIQVDMTGNGTLLLDRAGGAPRSKQMQYELAIDDYQFTVKLDYRQVDPDQIPAPRVAARPPIIGPRARPPLRVRPGGPRFAPAPGPAPAPGTAPAARPAPMPRPAPAPGEPLPDGELTALLLQLDEANQFRVRAALGKLKAAKPRDRRDEVRGRIEAALASDDGFTRNAAAAALKTWGDKASQPALITALQDDSFVVRHTAIEILGEIGDAAAAEAIVEVYEKNKLKAAPALKRLGPAAETAVWKLLESDAWPIRKDGCDILGAVGTARSLMRLQEVSQNEGGLVRRAAMVAIKQIEQRAAP